MSQDYSGWRLPSADRDCSRRRLMSDRYLRIVLTVIALELFWIGVKDFATPLGAQQARAQAPNAQTVPQAPAAAPVATPQPLPVVLTCIGTEPRWRRDGA